MPAAAPSGSGSEQPGNRLELTAEAVWHKQLHQSKVTVLSISADGASLWSGCDAAAPRPRGGNMEAPIVPVSCQDGSNLRDASGLPVANMRFVQPMPRAGGLLCVTAQGLVLALDSATFTVVDSLPLPGTPVEASANLAAAKASKAAAAAPATPPPCDGTATVDATQQAAQLTEPGQTPAGATADSPEFFAEAGYRGHREGYLFREGSRGRGYYRKDVVRLYCASAHAAPQGKTTLQTGAGSHAAAASCGAAQPATAEEGSAARAAEESRQYLQRLRLAPPGMHAVIADPSARLLITASMGHADASIRVWKLHWGGDSGAAAAGCPAPELFRTLTGHTGQVLSLALSPDGSMLYSGSYDQTIRAWSTADWHLQRVLRGHGGGVRDLAVAPDGSTLFSAAADNTIRAWSTRHWVCLRTLHGRHEDLTWPNCLALAPNGGLLASGSTGPMGGSTIKAGGGAWRAWVFQTGSGGGREAGTCLASFAQLKPDQKADISALRFSPDGGTLYSGASDGSVAAWRVAWRAPRVGKGIRKGFL